MAAILGRTLGRTMERLMLVGLFTISTGYSAYPFENKTIKEIDTEKSTMTVRVFKAGLFSVFGHNHEIVAPVAEGSFNEDQPAVSLRVESARLRVVDKDVSEKDRAEIQATMLGPEVLDVRNFAQISFKSTQVERQGDGKWLVHGDLTLHGQVRPIQVRVEGQRGHYHGWAELKQKDFGMTPVTVAGGTVKVKNEVRVEFDIFEK